ncbi:MAG: hypothetical protein CMO47_06070 [Verrucomicrobiales bacterium]|nr:hypothetical protein [Verrucomicrobiales bacterium]
MAELLFTDVETKFKSFPAKVVTKMLVLIEEEIIFARRHGDYQLANVVKISGQVNQRKMYFSWAV